MIKPNELVRLAKEQIGLPAIYRAGGGKIHPEGSNPLDSKGHCDCSAYVCWCVGISKMCNEFDWLNKLNGGWLNTDGIWHDADHDTGYFTMCGESGTPKPAPGSIIVYPGSVINGRRRYGHVGIVTDIRRRGDFKVVHCSSGNYRRKNDAIRETDSYVWDRRRDTRLLWPSEVIL